MKERTKPMDKKEYTKYIKWYNFAERIIQNEELIPKREENDVFNIISKENWLIFCKKDEYKEIAVNKPEPNVFFDIKYENARLGLTFNNLKSYERFKTIMHGYNKELKKKITSKLLKLDNSWKISISRKIKDSNYKQTPKYELVKEWNSNGINESIIDELLKKANNIREHGREERVKHKNLGKFYRETPSINLMISEFKLSEDEFKDRILEIFDILALCLNIKSDVEINKIKRELEKKLKEKELELKELVERRKYINFSESINKNAQDNEKKSKINLEIEELEKEIEKLRQRIIF